MANRTESVSDPPGGNKCNSRKSKSARLGFGLDSLDPIGFSASAVPVQAPPPTPNREFFDFKDQVYFTLASRTEGYDNAPELVQDLRWVVVWLCVLVSD